MQLFAYLWSEEEYKRSLGNNVLKVSSSCKLLDSLSELGGAIIL